MISNDIITPEEFKMLAPILSKDIIYTTDLLENILHWSRSQLKGYGINKEYFNLRNLIINEIDYHQPPASIKEIKIVHNVFPNVIVFADMLMIQIVVRNIINNAIKFSNTGGIIDISASYQRTGFVHLLIEDKGIGMPAEVVRNVFGGANISTRGTMHEKGTGLGLMICKEFMQRNDGDITVESEPEKGTIFTIKIPVEPLKE
jgi:signal transduction histidine kinase